MKKVKLLSNSSIPLAIASWRRQLPDLAPQWGECEFTFDPHARDYDWLVVYDRFPSVAEERFSQWREELACPPENTLFVTVEPSSIKTYESAFLAQFGHVLTGHESWSINHPGVIRSQPALRWFYGNAGESMKTLDQMLAETPCKKTASISTVCSNKQQKHTLHQKRYLFTQKLKTAVPELEVFGHGVRPMRDKAEAIDPYRFHIAIENHRCDHHWTEKVADVFLGWGLPLYYGCTNLKEYFPEDSFIEIDINDLAGTVELVKGLIASDEYEKRLPAIAKARDFILQRYNIFPVIADLVENQGKNPRHHPTSSVILSRHALRKSSVTVALSYAIQSLRRRWRSLP